MFCLVFLTDHFWPIVIKTLKGREWISVIMFSPASCILPSLCVLSKVGFATGI